jgi:hypothetical protein
VIGTFAPTVSTGEGWVFRSFTFVAPTNTSLLTEMVFTPVSFGNGQPYPGLDNVTLAGLWRLG